MSAEDERAYRELVFQQATQENNPNYIFVRNKKNKTNKTMYYLYTEDEESLLLCAINTDTYSFDISRNANEITVSDPLYCGKLVGDITKNTYVGTNFRNEEIIGIKYKKSNEKTGSFRQLTASVPPDIQLVQRNPVKIDGQWTLYYPFPTDIASSKNFIMEYQDDYCCVLEKIHQEEYILSIKYPLNLFQGFCLALSSMKKFPNE